MSVRDRILEAIAEHPHYIPYTGTGYCPMQLYYKTWGGQPYVRITDFAYLSEVLIAFWTEAGGAEVWGVAERLMARDVLSGKLLIGLRAIEEYLQRLHYRGFFIVSPRDLVPWNCRCPSCGERRIDQLIWQDDSDVLCVSCGERYAPSSGIQDGGWGK